MIRAKKTVAGMLLTVALAALSPAAAADKQPPAALPDWNAFIDAIRPAGNAVSGIYQPDDPQNRQDAYVILLGQLARGYLSHVQADPNYPELLPLYNSGLNIA